ncbi:hypothetical protein ACHAQJ_001177 [Trichoderma viride]
MAPSTRTKPNTRARMQRISTKFTELDVTPNRPGVEHDPLLLNEKEMLPLSEANADERLLDGYEAAESVFDETQQDNTTGASFAWSDAGSTNVTRRSSPVPTDDLPAEELWDFDDEDDEVDKLFASCDSKNQNLPDTMPLVRESQAKQPSLTPAPKVDFSETASSIRRSSPFLTSDARKDLWDFSDTLSSSESPINIAKHNSETEANSPAPSCTSHHLPMDDIYDATPRKTETPQTATQTAVEPKVKMSKTVSVIQGHSTVTTLHHTSESTSQPPLRASAKTKRRQRKAKEPIKFDPLTQEIIDIPKFKKSHPPPKLSIVSALQESAKGSTSPFASAKKTSRKQAPKQVPKQTPKQAPKKKQPRAKQTKKRKPEAEVMPHDAPDTIVLDSSPAQVAVDSPSESPQDLLCVHNDEEMKASQCIRMEDVSDPNDAPEEHQHQLPLVVDELENGPESLPTERTRFKRRKLSRQFSISEKGSPVVTKDAAPMNKADPAISERDSFLTNHANPVTVAQPPSFVRTASNDKLYGQQLDSAVGGIGDKASSRWLRRMDEQKPSLKHSTSTGRNIHDNIMKSFLGAAETLQGLRDPQPKTLVETRNREIEKQIYHTTEQLMIHLDSKKAAAFKIAEVYHTSGVASIAYLKQQCVKDCDNVVETLCKYGAMFEKNLHAAKDAVKLRRLSRARAVTELREVLKVRRLEYSKARLNLGAVL